MYRTTTRRHPHKNGGRTRGQHGHYSGHLGLRWEGNLSFDPWTSGCCSRQDGLVWWLSGGLVLLYQVANVPKWSSPAHQYLPWQLNSSSSLNHLVDLSPVCFLPIWLLGQLPLGPQEHRLDSSPITVFGNMAGSSLLHPRIPHVPVWFLTVVISSYIRQTTPLAPTLAPQTKSSPFLWAGSFRNSNHRTLARKQHQYYPISTIPGNHGWRLRLWLEWMEECKPASSRCAPHTWRPQFIWTMENESWIPEL